MKNPDLKNTVDKDEVEAVQEVEVGYQAPEIYEIGRAQDLLRGIDCCGPYDGDGYYPQ